jgi:Leu/Phe-tRNA-protein transferase
MICRGHDASARETAHKNNNNAVTNQIINQYNTSDLMIFNGENNIIWINYNSRAVLISVSDSQLIINHERSWSQSATLNYL